MTITSSTTTSDGARRPRIGWLGGSFDPVHEGHVAIARAAIDALDLDRVLLVPAAIPPHKRDKRLAPGDDRLALLELACRGDERLVPCDIELRRQGVSYSYDTARALRDELGDDVELFYVIGADTLADLATWSRIPELARLVTFCTLRRAGDAVTTDHLAGLVDDESRARIADHVIDAPIHPASSTAIREALAEGRDPEHLAPAVAAEIARRGLYGPT